MSRLIKQSAMVSVYKCLLGILDSFRIGLSARLKQVAGYDGVFSLGTRCFKAVIVGHDSSKLIFTLWTFLLNEVFYRHSMLRRRGKMGARRTTAAGLLRFCESGVRRKSEFLFCPANYPLLVGLFEWCQGCYDCAQCLQVVRGFCSIHRIWLFMLE